MKIHFTMQTYLVNFFKFSDELFFLFDMYVMGFHFQGKEKKYERKKN